MPFATRSAALCPSPWVSCAIWSVSHSHGSPSRDRVFLTGYKWRQTHQGRNCAHPYPIYIDFSIVLSRLYVCLCVTLCCCLCHTTLLYLVQVEVVNENLFSTGLSGLNKGDIKKKNLRWRYWKKCPHFSFCQSTSLTNNKSTSFSINRQSTVPHSSAGR